MFSWLKQKLLQQKTVVNQNESITISKTETPDKIIETRIRPVKIPTILDIGEKLGHISNDLSSIKTDIVSRSWFKSEYEDCSPLIIDDLRKIQKSLNLLIDTVNHINNNLSNFTKTYSYTKGVDLPPYPMMFHTPDHIIELIKKNGPMRFKELRTLLNVTDPTLSKYLKKLTLDNVLIRKKSGKAVFYHRT